MPNNTPSNPTYELLDLTLDAVALCQEGANSRAHILLSKHRKETSMTYEELIASLKPEQADLITKKITDAEQVKDATITDLQGKITALEKQKPAEQPADDVLKNASPEVKALFAKMQTVVDGLVNDKAEEIAKTRYEKCKAIPVEEAELKEVLKAASPKTIAVLESAAAAIEKSTLSSTGFDASNQGTGGATGDAAYMQLEKAARELMAKTEGLSFEKAFLQTCTDKPDVYKKYSEGVK